MDLLSTFYSAEGTESEDEKWQERNSAQVKRMHIPFWTFRQEVDPTKLYSAYKCSDIECEISTHIETSPI